jgi:hypothetical protein
MDKLEKLEANLNIALGRINGLHALLYVIARSLPIDIAKVCAENAELAKEKVIADSVALPIPDSMMNEQIRVLEEGVKILRIASTSTQ